VWREDFGVLGGPEHDGEHVAAVGLDNLLRQVVQAEGVLKSQVVAVSETRLKRKV
jgi:hypothetical protein